MLPLPGIKQIMAFTATQKIHLFQVKADSEFEARAKIKLPNQRGEALAEVAMTLSPGEQVDNLKRYHWPRLHQCSAPLGIHGVRLSSQLIGVVKCRTVLLSAHAAFVRPLATKCLADPLVVPNALPGLNGASMDLILESGLGIVATAALRSWWWVCWPCCRTGASATTCAFPAVAAATPSSAATALTLGITPQDGTVPHCCSGCLSC